MDLDSITRFVAVVDHGSFAAAARILDITPQALSTSIAKLEKSLGVVLFDRERGGITRPTDYGETFLPHARFILAAELRAVEEVHARRDARSGWVRLGVGESMSGAIVARAIEALRAEAPDARIAIIEGYTQDLLERLDEGELDLVAGAPDADRSQRRALAQLFLYATDDVLVVRRDHPLADRAKVSLKDLQGYTWLLPYARKDSYQVTIEAYAKGGLQPPASIIFSDSANVGLELLATQDDILFVSRDIFWPRLDQPEAPFVVLNAAQPTIERHACLMTRADYPLSAIAQRIHDLIVEFAADRGGTARVSTKRR